MLQLYYMYNYATLSDLKKKCFNFLKAEIEQIENDTNI